MGVTGSNQLVRTDPANLILSVPREALSGLVDKCGTAARGLLTLRSQLQ